MGEGWGEGKTTAPISDDPKTQGRLKSSANPNLVSGNRLKEYNGIEYTYDALGNLIYRQLPNGENQYYQYDLENQLVRAEIKKPAGNTEIWEYAYDPFGRRLSKERKDKLAWTSTEPKRTHFVWDGSRLLQEYTYKGSYTYIYTDQDSYEPLAQIFDNAKDGKQYLAYFHNDQIGIPREMTDIHGNLLWYGEYTAWGRLKKNERVYKNAHQPFRLQNQYFDEETGLHYNLMRYYEPEVGRFVNQDPIGLLGGENLYRFAPNVQEWVDPLGLWGFLVRVIPIVVGIASKVISKVASKLKCGKCVKNTSHVHPLRQAYIKEVNGLKALGEKMARKGIDKEIIARTLHSKRRELGVKYKNLTPPDKLKEIYARNVEKYGDKLGPSIDWLRKKGKSWDDIIESASRTGGKDLGL